jgi:hypothetical protein
MREKVIIICIIILIHHHYISAMALDASPLPYNCKGALKKIKPSEPVLPDENTMLSIVLKPDKGMNC